MSNVTAALPRKTLTSDERDFLKQGNRLLLDKPNGRIGAAALMDLVADWGNHRGCLVPGLCPPVDHRRARKEQNR